MARKPSPKSQKPTKPVSKRVAEGCTSSAAVPPKPAEPLPHWTPPPRRGFGLR